MTMVILGILNLLAAGMLYSNGSGSAGVILLIGLNVMAGGFLILSGLERMGVIRR